MPNVVRFVLDSARDLHVPGAGQFSDGVLDVDANNLAAVARVRYLVQPYRAIELGIVASTTPPPALPAAPSDVTPTPDPYPQYPTLDEIVASPDLKAAFVRRERGALAKLDARLAARMARPARLVFTGSSTTAGPNATSKDRRYVDLLVGMVQTSFPSGGVEPMVSDSSTAIYSVVSNIPGVHGYNVGDPGKTSWDWLTPDEQARVAALNPAAVFHMIGANDYTGGQVTVATYKANVLAAVNAIKAATAGPLVQVLIHTFRPPTGGVYQWSDFGKALREIADADPDNVVFIDVSDTFERLAHAGVDLLDLIDTDAVHMTNNGHRFMATLLALALGYPPIPQRGRILLSDPFDRADGALGVADTGQSWETLVGTWTLVGGKVSITAGGTVHTDAGSSDVDLTCTITNGTQTPGVVFRSQDENNRLGIFFASAGGTTVDLIRKDGGVNTTIASGNTPAPSVSGRNFRVRILAVGDRVTVWVNDVVVLNHQLAAADHTKYKAFTRVGFRCAAADAAIRWDDLLVKVPAG